MTRPRSLALAFAALVLAPMAALFVAGADSASAHPLGNFTINRFARVELYRNAVHIQYVVDMAEIPTFQLISEIDTDGDGLASQPELEAFVTAQSAALSARFDLRLDGRPLTVEPLTTTIELLPGQGGLQVARYAIAYRAPAESASAATLTFEDSNFAERAGWKEIVVRPSSGVTAQVAPALLIDQSDALRAYPSESLTSAPDMRAISLTWDPNTGAAEPNAIAAEAGGPARTSSGFSSLLDREQSASIILLSLLAAFGFGALHALGPGHGKTVVAAYLVGSRGTVRHAVALGATVTATHTSTVYLMGFITLSASAFIVPETLYLYLGVASGLLVLLMGAALLTSRLRSLRPSSPEAEHRHGWFGRAHSHAPAPHTHAAAHDHDHPHDHDDHDHGAEHARDHNDAHDHGPVITWRGLLTLGVAGGIMPCPSAIVVMLSAIALGQVLFGMLLIVAFSLGLAGVLTGIGVGLVVGKRLSRRTAILRRVGASPIARLAPALPVLSAFGVTLAGLAITYNALNQPGL